MKYLKAFVRGMIEFRSAFTTHYDDEILAYDSGREFAHKLTLRRFEVQS